MKTKYRFASLVGVVAIVAAACSGTSATPSPAASTAASTAPSTAASEAPSTAASMAPSAAPLTGSITVWEAYGASGSAEKTAFDAAVKNVMTANPGLTVTVLDVPFANLFTKFETEAASGGGPDLYIAPNDSVAKEMRAGLLKDLSSMSATLMAAPYNISQTAITADTVDGKLAGIPESMKAVALFYNSATLPTPPKTTADWLTAVKTTPLGLVYGANGGGAYYQWGLYGSFGGKILDETTGKCAATATTGVADSMKFLTDFKAAGGILYKNDTDAKTDFLAGKIAGFIDGPWQSGDLQKALGDKLAVVPGPSGTGGNFSPMTAPDGYYINASSANQDLAIQFALQMLSPENVKPFVDNAGHIPANTVLAADVANGTNVISKGFAQQVATGFARPTAKELDNYWTPFGNAIASVVEKGTDPTAAVADACTQMDKANGK
jgi:arabinogalactan oligomer / maltooligosaccharide transport system substrate-binding protein